MVIVDHGEGLQTVYAPHHANLVRKGEWAQSGEVIAEVGSSGNATAPHLHFEVLRRNRPRDPLRYLASPEYAGRP